MIPQKPFDSYKWRWFSKMPTEGLLEPPVFLGVLRVLARHIGEAPTTEALAAELDRVKRETNSRVDLARTNDRNLLRNSGQYWKGTGLLAPTHGLIELTSLGRRIAEGSVARAEFAAIMVQQTILPNPWTATDSERADWKAAKLEIRPLRLILDILAELSRNYGPDAAFLTPLSLRQVVIPLAGMRMSAKVISEYVYRYARGELNTSNWPNCVPDDNDHRFAREFLLFLYYFGLCGRRKTGRSNDGEEYYLETPIDMADVPKVTNSSIFSEESHENAVSEVLQSALPSIIERQRTLTSLLSRPGQMKFRKDILASYHGRCLLSGEAIPEVLEAAHIIPIANGGEDLSDNGFCLRVDIHRLFDSGNIRIATNGDVLLSETVSKSLNYAALPRTVMVPRFVKSANLDWRLSYL